MIVDTTACASKILDVHGQRGAAWLEALPVLLEEFAARWSLIVLPPFPIPSYNYVAPAIGQGGEAWVLKAGVPHGELWSEIDALWAFDGQGIARLLDADREHGALLLERVLPGEPLKNEIDENQIAALVSVLRRLWRPLPAEHPFRTIPDLARGLDRLRTAFDDGYGPFPPRRVERAAALFRELTGDAAPPLLIHGDVNPGNILRSERDDWLAIDPKGYAGHPLYDVATFLNDPPPLAAAELRRRQSRRVAMLVEALDAPTADVLAWAEAHATLSAWWTYEERGVAGEEALALAEMYERLFQTR
jgi:streptomycin 6-kinase